METHVISGAADGAELRREKYRNPRHVRCDGTADQEDINTVIASSGKPAWSFDDEGWERVFGRGKRDGSND